VPVCQDARHHFLFLSFLPELGKIFRGDMASWGMVACASPMASAKCSDSVSGACTTDASHVLC
jgi:hypothetical protein